MILILIFGLEQMMEKGKVDEEKEREGIMILIIHSTAKLREKFYFFVIISWVYFFYNFLSSYCNY